jgi:hypothetical protein
MNNFTHSPFSLFNPSLFPLPHRPAPPPLADFIFPISLAVCITSFIFPSQFRQALPIPAIIILFHYARGFESPVDYTDNYMTYIHLLWTLIRWVDFTILHKPEDLCRTDSTGQTIETQDEVKAYSWPRKLYWSASLMTSIRGINWNWQVSNIPPISSSRLHACLHHAFNVVKYNLIMDIKDYVVAQSLLEAVTVESYFALPLWHQILYVAAGILNSAAGIGLSYHALAFFCTATHVTNPTSWPPMFGSWSSFSTVRGAWGKLWHQMLRRFFTVSNNLILSSLNIKRGTLLSKYTQIYIAFLLSALFHHVGALNLPYMNSVPYQFLFFLLQPVCITIEDMAIALGRHVGVRDGVFGRGIGCIWTGCALGWTGRYMAVYFSESGAMLAPTPKVVGVLEYVLPVFGVGTGGGMKE